MSDIVDAIDKAMAMLQNPRRLDRCPPHLVHPRFQVLADGSEAPDDVEWAGCANLCGALLPFKRDAIGSQIGSHKP